MNVHDHIPTIETDICIIGAGVAGLVIAKRLIDSGFRVLLLEAGDRVWTEEHQETYQADIRGCPYKGHIEGRFRTFGGSSIRWGGQLLPLEQSDFAMQPHVEKSGWPIQHETLKPFYHEAQNLMKVNHLPFDERLQKKLSIKPLHFDTNYFQFKYSKWMRFQDRNLAVTLGKECEEAKNITLLLNSPVKHIQLNLDGTSVQEIHLEKNKIHATHYIICCGTLETTRLLLAANNISKEGIGNKNNLVGKYFQDHISFRAAELKPKNMKLFTDTFSPHFINKIMHYPRIQFTDKAKTTLSCFSVFGHVIFESAENSCFSLMRDILRRMQATKKITVSWTEIKNILRSLPYFFRLSCSYFIGGKIPYQPGCRWYLQVDVEQAPSKQSYVFLSQQRDASNMPKLSIDWQPGERERITAKHFIDHFKNEWEKNNVGDAIWNETINESGHAWLSSAHDAFHQAGTTRMHDDPALGVVDSNLKVHGIDNLFISSCSVFPTSGSANPTFTLMALSLRLADHLSTKILHHCSIHKTENSV